MVNIIQEIYRDAADGATAALKAAFPNADQHRDLQHVKRNVKDWMSKKSGNLKESSLRDGILARFAFSSAFLQFEFHVFWTFLLERLQGELGETKLADYLRDYILVEKEGLIDAEWSSSLTHVPPGYGLYVSNNIERLRQVYPEGFLLDVSI